MSNQEPRKGKLYQKIENALIQDEGPYQDDYWYVEHKESISKVLDEAKADAPTNEKMMHKEKLGNGLVRYSKDVAEQNKLWQDWYAKWFGASKT